tara:strand:+ start:2068 stop:2235 length:168 start_codon:yes stop_codon:yes gene_type:complete
LPESPFLITVIGFAKGRLTYYPKVAGEIKTEFLGAKRKLVIIRLAPQVFKATLMR